MVGDHSEWPRRISPSASGLALGRRRTYNLAVWTWENNLITQFGRLPRPAIVALAAISMMAFGGLLAGCDGAGMSGGFTAAPSSGASTPVPAPINLTLPKTVKIHEFTTTRTFDELGGIPGIDARVEALDAFGDTTKAFGDFRFELFKFKPNAPDPKGLRLGVWEEKLLDPKVNRTHWDEINRAYQFKLKCDKDCGLGVGDKYVLVVTFSSPFSNRLFSNPKIFVAGQ
jgi:hypothetical protein